MALRLRPVTRHEHLAFVTTRSSMSFLQCPSWAQVKSEWASESLGWFDDLDRMVGVALVLYRKIPRLKRYLAYIPEGPVIDWGSEDLDAWLNPLVEHLRSRNAFGIKMGPPVSYRRWNADTIKDAIAQKSAKRLLDLRPDETNAIGAQVAKKLRAAGWQPPPDETGFSAGQPRYVF